MDMQSFFWNSDNNIMLFTNFLVIISLFAFIRFFASTISNIKSADKLFVENNIAEAICLFGVIFSVTIVVSGIIYLSSFDVGTSALNIAIYGVSAILLMVVSRFIFDKIAMPHIEISNQIEKGNIAAAIIDAGNLIATAIIIRAVMVWIATNTVKGVIALFIGYLISQILLTSATFLRAKMFHLTNKKHSMEDLFANNNVALGLRFSGRRIGSAFAVMAASNIMTYEIENIINSLFVWAVISIIMIIVLEILSFIADKVILYKISINQEILKNNVAVGLIQCIVYISLGLLLSALLV